MMPKPGEDEGAKPHEYDDLFSRFDRIDFDISAESAMATIVVGAVRSSGVSSTHDFEEAMAAFELTAIGRGLRAEERRALIDENLAKATEPIRLIDGATFASATLAKLDKSKSPGIAISAFARACEIVLHDGDIDANSQRYIKVLAERLAIPSDKAIQIVETIRLLRSV